MDYIEHPILYTDNWERKNKKNRSAFWRRHNKRKIRRAIKDLLNNTRPRINLSWESN